MNKLFKLPQKFTGNCSFLFYEGNELMIKEIQIQETLLSGNKFCGIRIIPLHQRTKLYRFLILGFLLEEKRTLHSETPFVLVPL